MGCLAEKGRDLSTFLAVREAGDPTHAEHLIADALPPVVASVLEPAETPNDCMSGCRPCRIRLGACT